MPDGSCTRCFKAAAAGWPPCTAAAIDCTCTPCFGICQMQPRTTCPCIVPELKTTAPTCALRCAWHPWHTHSLTPQASPCAGGTPWSLHTSCWPCRPTALQSSPAASSTTSSWRRSSSRFGMWRRRVAPTRQPRPSFCTCSMLRLPPSTGATRCLEPHTTLDSSLKFRPTGWHCMPSLLDVALFWNLRADCSNVCMQNLRDVCTGPGSCSCPEAPPPQELLPATLAEAEPQGGHAARIWQLPISMLLLWPCSPDNFVVEWLTLRTMHIWQTSCCHLDGSTAQHWAGLANPVAIYCRRMSWQSMHSGAGGLQAWTPPGCARSLRSTTNMRRTTLGSSLFRYGYRRVLLTRCLSTRGCQTQASGFHDLNAGIWML